MKPHILVLSNLLFLPPSKVKILSSALCSVWSFH